MLTISAVLGQVPPDHRGGYVLERQEITSTSSTYDEALDDLDSRVPEGWRILAVRVDRDADAGAA